MIDIRELRIGNIISYNDRLIEVDELRKETKSIFANGWQDDDNLLNRVLLTDEWLLKFGFRFKRETNQIELFEYTYMPIDHQEDPYNILMTLEKGKYTIFYKLKPIGVLHIKYVHQLQNLFFILTGIELTITEQPKEKIKYTHGDNCNSLDSVCDDCYNEYKEWKKNN